MDNILVQATELMVAGMGFVFAFLIVLVYATSAMSRIIVQFAPPEPVTPAKAPNVPKPVAASAVNPQVVAAIKMAVAEYRSRHKK